MLQRFVHDFQLNLNRYEQKNQPVHEQPLTRDNSKEHVYNQTILMVEYIIFSY